MTDKPLFNEAELAEIVELMGEELQTLIDAFRSSGGDQMSRMHSARRNRDVEQLAEAVHQLKGSSGNLGATALHGRCESLEQMVRAGDMSGADGTIEQIAGLYAKTLAELGRRFGGN